MAIYSNIDFYLDLFEGLRDKINYLVYSSQNNNFYSVPGYSSVDDLKKFSLMFMFSSDSGNSFRWLLLEDQKQFVIKALKDKSFSLSRSINTSINTYEQLIDRLGISAENYFKIWIEFKLKESGFIKYFMNSKKNTEFIQDFSEEKFLIGNGYLNDYDQQLQFKNLREKYLDEFNVDFDPFATLERIWGFNGVPFYYIKLPKLESLEFVAIFPMIHIDKENFFKKADFLFSLIKNAVLGANLMKSIIDKSIIEIRKQYLKSAIISILIDSYAHNISAHSLAALKWWIELRYKMFDKRFEIKNGSELNCLQPSSIVFNKDKKNHSCDISNFIKISNTKETTLKYYEALGLTDSTYNENYYSLFDFLKFVNTDTVKNLFQFSNEVELNNVVKFYPRFPVPIDYALFPFFRFLRDKGAFWSGVTRDMAFGGESKTWYKILWEDFANNPLYLGTIAKSEGITKLNINLKVKTKDGIWVQGRFVTIDMSIIDYEEKLSQSPTLELTHEEYEKYLKINHEYKDSCEVINNVKNHKLESKCYESTQNFVEDIKYSKYSFVRLGKCFAHFREILSDEENFRVFLPGGIVGEHALFTIFENTIRNIKHYKEPTILSDIQQNGIDIWISIEEDKLWITKQNESQEISQQNQSEQTNYKKLNNPSKEKKPELFKVGVWLEHPTELVRIEKKKEKNENGKEVEIEAKKYLIFDITENTLKQILDEQTGVPRMGGNSQDKSCAAMLFNNLFSSVEKKGDISKKKDKREERDNEYFPWIRFAAKHKTKEFSLIIKNDTEVEDVALLKTKYETDFLCNGNEGTLKKYFYLWRGEDVFIVEKESDFDAENVSRFRFVVIDNKEEKEKLETRAREEGVIRIMDKKLNKRTLYNHWLLKFLYLNSHFTDETKYLQYNLRIIAPNNTTSTFGDIIVGKNSSIFIGKNSKNFREKYKPVLNNKQNYRITKDDKDRLIFAHRSTMINDGSFCNIRSHGWFLSRLFEGCNGSEKVAIKFPEGKVYSIPNGRLDLFEFLEAILSRVIIFDNRVFERFPKDPSQKPVRHYEDKLNLVVYKEDNENFDEFQKSYTNSVNSTLRYINFLVVHLSFIESLDYKGKKINDFMKDKIVPLKNLYPQLILVITTGRGRDEWWEKLEPEYKKYTIFKPIESILSSIETGVSYKDDIDIKFNLIKVLFGS